MPIHEEIQELLHTVSHLTTSGATTPTLTADGRSAAAAAALGGFVAAQDLVTRLNSRSTSPAAVAHLTPTTIWRPLPPLREWTTGQPLDLIILTNPGGSVIPVNRLPALQTLINLHLYDLQCHLVPSGGYLLRFTLLEWDEDRLDQLLISIKRGIPEGAQARVARTLLHDAFWSWRLQITIFLASSPAAVTSVDLSIAHHKGLPMALIAPL